MNPANPPRARGLGDVDTWIFDLDNTLYRMSDRLAAQMDDLMGSFIRGLLGVDRDEAYRLQKDYFRRYGLTLRGLMLHHAADPDAYRDHLAALDLSDIGPDPDLARAIGRLPGRKIIYTNMFSGHTEKVVRRLGVSGCFDGVFDIGSAGYVPKPAIEPYRCLCDRYGIDPRRAVMIEDIAVNLEPAAELGMGTVWLRSGVRRGPEVVRTDHIDHVIDDLAVWLDAVADGLSGDCAT